MILFNFFAAKRPNRRTRLCEHSIEKKSSALKYAHNTKIELKRRRRLPPTPSPAQQQQQQQQKQKQQHCV